MPQSQRQPNFPGSPSDHKVLRAFSCALDDVVALKATLATLRTEYLALEAEMRERLEEYVAVRQDANEWKERYGALERRIDSNNDVVSRGLRAQNDCLARRARREGEMVGVVRRRRGSYVFVRGGERSARIDRGGGALTWDRVSEGLGRWKRALRRRWCEVREGYREQRAAAAENERQWREHY